MREREKRNGYNTAAGRTELTERASKVKSAGTSKRNADRVNVVVNAGAQRGELESTTNVTYAVINVKTNRNATRKTGRTVKCGEQT